MAVFEIALPLRPTIRAIVAGGTLLWSLSLLAHILYGATGIEWLIYGPLSLNVEASFYTWASAAVLLLGGLSALTLAGSGVAQAARWRVLGIGFVALSADEAVGLHDALSEAAALRPLFRRIVPAGFDAVYAWPLLAAAAGALLLAWFVPFLRSLDRRLMRQLVAAGAIFCTGAIGFELVEGAWTSAHGYFNWQFVAISHVEEGLELVGAILFLRIVQRRLAVRSPAD